MNNSASEHVAFTRLDLGEGQLPECFEADERSDPAAEDVLQLVSGRRVLGVVREQKTELLQGMHHDSL